MQQKCRKLTAAFLICTLAFLAVVTELTHHQDFQNASQQTQVTQQQDRVRAPGQSHDTFCVACWLALTHLAISVSLQPRFFGVQPATLLPTFSLLHTGFNKINSTSLRAPPAVLV